MLETLGLNLPTLTVALLVASAAYGSFKSVVKDHKSGGCGGCCGGCANAPHCHAAERGEQP